MGVIYKIESPTGKLYVGKTYDLKKRIAGHKCAVKYGKNLILHNSIRKYGWGAHKFEIIEEVADEIMNEREMFWISELRTYCYENENGMNMTKGGDAQRSTWMHKTELRKWFSEKFSGEGNPFYGKTHSKEIREEMSKKASLRNKKDGRKKVMKEVLQYDLNGNFLREFVSVTEAAKYLNIAHSNISYACSGIATNAGGYIFKYKTNNYPIKIEVGNISIKNVKRPVLTLNEDYEIITEHPSAKESSEFWGVPKTTINRAAMYNWLVPIRSGHVFIYTDLYEEILKAAS